MNGSPITIQETYRTLIYGVDGETSQAGGMGACLSLAATTNDWMFFTGDVEWFAVEAHASAGTAAWTSGILTVERANNKKGTWYALVTGTTITATGGMSDRIESTSEWTRIRCSTAEANVAVILTVHMRLRQR